MIAVKIRIDKKSYFNIHNLLLKPYICLYFLKGNGQRD
ncbi:hypothetical protein SAMN05216269_11187 [Flavobacterium xinjiangense]|uniref:Uncharacterized protein n=1 Tax=Flavobacterium xinjiangense TaxID=178356 RepID=A0A1M7NKI5_9FLAO|nr:hypothetical protein SAMN05216269_11187 [Flavobacterium xinjiangense]